MPIASPRSDLPRTAPHGSGRPAVLYLVHRFPYPPDKGDRIRAFHIIQWLATRADVHLACLADEPVAAESLQALQAICTAVAVVRLDARRWVRALGSLARGRTVTEGGFAAPALARIVRRWAGQTQFRAALASSSGMAPYLRFLGPDRVPVVVDLVDVDSQKWLDYAQTASGWRAWLYRTEAKRLRALERDLATWTRAITLVSPAEAELYRIACPGVGRVHAITNGVDLAGFLPREEPDGLKIVFIGALDYRPNVDGVRWFAHQVWPEIRQRYPRATLSLVGRRPGPAVSALEAIAGVHVVGSVADVRPYLADAAIAVVPLQIARGVQNKVLEALAMARAVVASPAALTGLVVEPGTHLLAAETAAEWVAALARLFDDEPLRRQLGQAGRRFVVEHHQWASCLDPFGPLLNLAAPANAAFRLGASC